jgi:glucose-6-phosphate 1-dehydrogenase
VQITVAESIGVEDRGAFYEETGAARDVLQNHLLQLLSLVAMEPPATFEADALRDEKVKVLRAIREHRRSRSDGRRPRPVRPGLGRRPGGRGYREEPRSTPSPRRRRSSRARLTIDDWRWSGVPFYLRTGKRLPKRATEIAIQFRDVPHRLFRERQRPGAEPARDPHPAGRGDHARFGAKVPGLGLDVRT